MTIINKIFKNKTDNTLIQLFRYTFVGGFACIVDFGFLFLATEFLGIHYLISAAIAFLLGLAVNYILSTFWVFNKRRLKNKWIEFNMFALIGIAGLCFNELFIWIFTDFINFHYLVSKIFSTFFVYLWNFFARKYFLFR